MRGFFYLLSSPVIYEHHQTNVNSGWIQGEEKYFADDGWDQITVAFPVNVREYKEINSIASNTDLTILIDSVESLELLSTKLDHDVKFMIEIISDYHRTGVHFENHELINEILATSNSAERLTFKGFYSHSGNTYLAGSLEDIERIHRRTCKVLKDLKSEYSNGFEIEVSLGDTPACSSQDYFEGIDIMGPGNFVFFDLMQVELGACQESDIAIVMACPVVYKNLERLEIVIYGGGVHFSRDYLLRDDQPFFGTLVDIHDTGWSTSLPGCYLSSISQEHGIATVSKEVFNKLNVGDIIGILPIHSCMTADLMGEYSTFDGRLIDHMSGPKF